MTGLPAVDEEFVGAVDKVVPVDLHIRGCPPRPAALLEGLIALMDRAATGGSR